MCQPTNFDRQSFHSYGQLGSTSCENTYTAIVSGNSSEFEIHDNGQPMKVVEIDWDNQSLGYAWVEVRIQC
jgi:hypothetical protein